MTQQSIDNMRLTLLQGLVRNVQGQLYYATRYQKRGTKNHSICNLYQMKIKTMTAMTCFQEVELSKFLQCVKEAIWALIYSSFRRLSENCGLTAEDWQKNWVYFGKNSKAGLWLLTSLKSNSLSILKLCKRLNQAAVDLAIIQHQDLADLHKEARKNSSRNSPLKCH